MHVFDRPPVRAYLTIREVPARFGTCYLWRSPGRILIAARPGTPRAAVVDYIVTHCTLTEQNAYRWQAGQGPVGTPIDDWMLDGAFVNVLPELRLESEMLAYGVDVEWFTASAG